MDKMENLRDQLSNKTDREDASSSLFQLFDNLKVLTVKIVARLEKASQEDMLEFINEREKIITEIQRLERTQQGILPSKAIESEIKEILSHDREILARLAEIQKSTSEKMMKTSVARKQRSAYDAVYTLDGVYFDKRN